MNGDERMLARLSMVKGITHKRISRLLSMAKTPGEAAEIDPALIRKALGPECAQGFITLLDESVLDRLLEKLCRMGIRLITRMSPEYPARLANIFDPPYTLYAKGPLSLNCDKTVAVIGSRHGTRYGSDAAHILSRDLSAQGVAIVSGMARGVDASAHMGALASGGKTIAVLGSGLDICYPPEHRDLYDSIAANGLLVSEYMPGVGPIGHHFIARNRIIAGLCEAIIMVEGAIKSGAMITVNLATDQGREVFAVPGQITSPLSYHPNRLIRDGAHMALEASDVLEVMGWGGKNTEKKGPNAVLLDLDEQERTVIKPLLLEDLSFDQLCEKTAIAPDSLNSLLTMLELRGIIKQHPGKIFSVFLSER